VAEGQYRFHLAGTERSVLWKGIPAGLSGTVAVTDLYGNESAAAASTLAPSGETPVIVTVLPARRRSAGK
jgi:hypothetical protein